MAGFLTNTLLILMATGIAISNAQSVPDGPYSITDLEGWVLTAYPEIPTIPGHLYPDPGYVFTQILVRDQPNQIWGVYNAFGGKKYLITNENSGNEIRVFKSHSDSFPLNNDWTIQNGAEAGTHIISTNLAFAPEVSCINHHGRNQRITFGPCDLNAGSASHWRFVPIEN